MEEFDTQGEHVVADCWGFENLYMDNQHIVLDWALKGALKTGANILSWDTRRDDDGNVKVGVVLSESHLTIHTYPSKGYVHIDCYTCGSHVQPIKAIDYIISKINPPRTKIVIWSRGIKTEVN